MLWDVHPLEIPVKALPGAPPELAQDWGYISLSHCRDALLIGWSKNKLGVDLERTDRAIPANQLANRYFSQKEKAEISQLKDEALRIAVLEQWLIKEAAIKWQRGKLSKEVSQWIFLKDRQIAYHLTQRQKVELRQINYGSWSMAIACNLKDHPMRPILCVDSL